MIRHLTKQLLAGVVGGAMLAGSYGAPAFAGHSTRRVRRVNPLVVASRPVVTSCAGDRGILMEIVNLAEKLARTLENTGVPKLSGSSAVKKSKLVKFHGTFVWHHRCFAN